MVPEAGFSISLFDTRGVRRSLSPSNVPSLVNLVAAVRRAVRLFRRIEPAVVVSVGGYASVPAVAAARMRRVPILVVSYDAVPGRASRLAARMATASAVAFESSPLPRKVVTGAPLRPEILATEPARDQPRARAVLGLPADRFTLLVVGGSLGSGALNDYQPLAFETRMDLSYAAADLVVARAGATTVAELAALGVPSILVPWPLASEDHQTANARALADAGGAVLITESQFDADRLATEVERLQRDPAALQAMARGARSVGRRGAAAAIARLAEELAAGEADR